MLTPLCIGLTPLPPRKGGQDQTAQSRRYPRRVVIAQRQDRRMGSPDTSTTNCIAEGARRRQPIRRPPTRRRRLRNWRHFPVVHRRLGRGPLRSPRRRNPARKTKIPPIARGSSSTPGQRGSGKKWSRQHNRPRHRNRISPTIQSAVLGSH